MAEREGMDREKKRWGGKGTRRGRTGGEGGKGQVRMKGKGIEGHAFEFCQIESSVNDDDYVNQHCCDMHKIFFLLLFVTNVLNMHDFRPPPTFCML